MSSPQCCGSHHLIQEKFESYIRSAAHSNDTESKGVKVPFRLDLFVNSRIESLPLFRERKEMEPSTGHVGAFLARLEAGNLTTPESPDEYEDASLQILAVNPLRDVGDYPGTNVRICTGRGGPTSCPGSWCAVYDHVFRELANTSEGSVTIVSIPSIPIPAHLVALSAAISNVSTVQTFEACSKPFLG